MFKAISKNLQNVFKGIVKMPEKCLGTLFIIAESLGVLEGKRNFIKSPNVSLHSHS